MDYWSTNDPKEIEQFMQNIQQGKGIETYNLESWNHTSDSEFIGNLFFNDETNTFYSNFNTVENGIVHSNGIRIKASSFNEGKAKVYHDLQTKAELENTLFPRLEGLEHLIGPMAYYVTGSYIHKTSRLAKFIFPGSRIVGNASTNTSLLSLTARRGLKGVSKVSGLGSGVSLGGQIGRVGGKLLGPIGAALTLYDAATIGWELGEEYAPISTYLRKREYEKETAVPVLR